MKKWVLYSFLILVFASLTAPFWVFSYLLFPFVSSKAFFFRIAIELALPFYAYLVLAHKELRPHLRNWLNIAVLAFLAINIITSFTGINVARSLWGNFERMGGTYYLAHLVLLYFYVQLIGQLGGRYLKWFLQAFLIAALVVAINGLSGWIGGHTLVTDPSLPSRVSSMLGNPIFLGSYMIIPMFVAAYFAAQEQRRGWKITYWIAAALLFLGMYSSDTRGATVGLVAGLFLGAVAYVLLAESKKIKRYGGVLIVLCVLLGGGLYAERHHLPPTSKLSRLVNLQDANSAARLIQWKTALEGFKDHSLLGVGPENYYLIANQYYNPAIYQYDPSWFDKPHNFLIEVLVTNGVFGFLAYAGMFGLALYGLWRSYKAGLLSLLEMCLLVTAIIAYQIQNLFVFDTVAASITYYALLGLACYMWVESRREDEVPISMGNISLANGALVAAGIAVVVIVYISNIESLEAAKRVNFGYVYTSYNMQQAVGYFDSAVALKFNLDPRETANRYSEALASAVSAADNSVDPKLLVQMADKATAVQKTVTEQVQNDPLLWMNLAEDKMYQALIKNEDPSAAEPEIQKAISLAPKRAELWQMQLQLDSYTKNWKDAVAVAQKIVDLDPFQTNLRWQLAMAYELSGQTDEAVKAGDAAVAHGMKFEKLQQFAWYIQYYENEKDYAKVAPLLEQAVALEPSDINLYRDLAVAYAHLGNFEKARLLAQQVETSDPSQKAAMDDFIKSLPSH